MDTTKWRVVPCEATKEQESVIRYLRGQTQSSSAIWNAALAEAPTTDAPTLIDPAELAALRQRLAEAERDAGRLLWFYVEGPDQIGDIDLHEQAAIYASAFARDEPNDADALAAIRDALDAVMEKKS